MATTEQEPRSQRDIGGYGLMTYRQAGGDETVRFEAILTRNGDRIATVANGGTGGCHDYRPVGEDYAAYRAAMSDLAAFATAWNADSEYAGHDDTDAFVDHLCAIAELNRMRSVVVLLDDDDYFDVGTYRPVPFRGSPEAARAAVLRDLAGPAYVTRNPRVWNRATSRFEPVAQTSTEGGERD